MKYDGYRKYTGAVARNYDRDREGEAHWEAENAYVARYGAEHSLGRVLDVPVGTGRFLASFRPAAQIVGVDVSPSMLEESAARITALRLAQASLARADALQLPFGDASFDTVFCFRLVHLLPPGMLAPLFRELARVARGRVLVQCYLKRTPALALPPWIRRAARVLRGRRPPPQAPWSHIESFFHARELVERALGGSGLTRYASRSLGEYQGSSVEVLELGK